MKKTLILLFLLTLSPALFAERGRPVISNGTFVTDTGELLRGGRHSVDLVAGGWLPPGCTLGAPSCASINNLKKYGLNALHIYAERAPKSDDPDPNQRPADPVGQNEAVVTQIVKWTRDADLYLIITIGRQESDLDHTRRFWEFYAPLYKDYKHVIYEIKNEPTGSWTPPSTRLVRDLMRKTFTTIRTRAPLTPILLFSYPFFERTNGIVADIDFMSAMVDAAGKEIPDPVVDWSNAGVAFHGYQASCGSSYNCDLPATTDATIAHIRQNRQYVAMVNTEFYTTTGLGTFKQAKTQIYEDRHVSWMTFVPLDYMTDAIFKDPIDSEEVVWSNQWPGFNWPAVNAPPVLATVSLRAKNGKFVTVLAGTRALVASSAAAGPAEKFVVKRPTGTLPHVCLQALANMQYVMAHDMNQNKLESSAGFCTNGRFEWMKRPNNSVVLRWITTHKTVDANVTSDATLEADRVDTPTGEATNFTVTTY